MPIFEMTTNVGNVSDAFISQVSKEVSLLTQKDESKVCVYVTDGAKLHFGGSNEPAAFIKFHSIGMKVEDHADISESFSKILDSIGVSSSRYYIQFNAPLSTHVGKCGTTIAELNRPKEDVIHF